MDAHSLSQLRGVDGHLRKVTRTGIALRFGPRPTSLSVRSPATDRTGQAEAHVHEDPERPLSLV